MLLRCTYDTPSITTLLWRKLYAFKQDGKYVQSAVSVDVPERPKQPHTPRVDVSALLGWNYGMSSLDRFIQGLDLCWSHIKEMHQRHWLFSLETYVHCQHSYSYNIYTLCIYMDTDSGLQDG